MAGAVTQLAQETTMVTAYNNNLQGIAPPDASSDGQNRWWHSRLRVVKEMTTEKREEPGQRYFAEVLLNVSILLVAVLVTVLIIGSVGMLHETKTTMKKETASDIHMVLPENDTPPPVELEEEFFMEEPEMIYTVKNLQAPKTEKAPPKIKINLPRIDINAKLPSGLDIGMVTWNISPPKSEYGIGEVDQVPMAIFQIPPDYPYHAKHQGTEGVVSIRFLVTREGEVSSFSVIKATPEGIFDEATRRSVLQWQFKPGVKNGKAVDTWVEMDIEFELG